jgi:hypothetical protein
MYELQMTVTAFGARFALTGGGSCSWRCLAFLSWLHITAAAACIAVAFDHCEAVSHSNTMSSAEEATINPDGTTQFPSDSQPQSAPSPDTAEPPPNPYETAQPASATGIDPALYLIAAVVLAGLFFYFFVHRKRSQQKEDNFFLELDGEKVGKECRRRRYRRRCCR